MNGGTFFRSALGTIASMKNTIIAFVLSLAPGQSAFPDLTAEQFHALDVGCVDRGGIFSATLQESGIALAICVDGARIYVAD